MWGNGTLILKGGAGLLGNFWIGFPRARGAVMTETFMISNHRVLFFEALLMWMFCSSLVTRTILMIYKVFMLHSLTPNSPFHNNIVQPTSSTTFASSITPRQYYKRPSREKYDVWKRIILLLKVSPRAPSLRWLATMQLIASSLLWNPPGLSKQPRHKACRDIFSRLCSMYMVEWPKEQVFL